MTASEHSDLILALERRPKGAYRTLVLDGPAGLRAEGVFDPPYGESEVPGLLKGLAVSGRAHRDSTEHVSDGPREFTRGTIAPPFDSRKVGCELYRALFRDSVGEVYLQSLEQTQALSRRLRIRLVFGVGAGRPDYIAALPWELLCSPEGGGFLALRERVSVVRELDVASEALSRPASSDPFRVLVAMSQAAGYRPLELDREWEALRHELADFDGIELELFRDASIVRLRERLLEGRFHGLHFMGHGYFDRESGTGQLLFEREEGGSQAIPGHLLAINLRDLPELRLTVLNACHTGALGGSGGQDPFLGIASALLLAGQETVIAMQSAIPDRAAIAFSRGFYRALARRRPLEGALFEGRLQILNRWSDQGAAWAIPVLFRSPSRSMRSTEGDPAEPAADSPISVRTPAESLGPEMSQSLSALSSRLLNQQSGRITNHIHFDKPPADTRDDQRQPRPKSAAWIVGVSTVLIGLSLVLVFRFPDWLTGGGPTSSHPAAPPPENTADSSTEGASDPLPPEPRAKTENAGPRITMTFAQGAKIHLYSQAAIPAVFESTFRGSGLPLSQEVIHLYLDEPHISDTTVRGLSWKSCRLGASGRIDIAGGSSQSIAPIPMSRTHSDGAGACTKAIKALAEASIESIGRIIYGGT